ncbi:hypothetical protein LH044_01820 [Dermatobacter hominis]|nr:hypothetical protein [Dermatobacter hominis]UDY36283.1 hypothetical protein LH044_01820 [Dermatobacter hominis]
MEIWSHFESVTQLFERIAPGLATHAWLGGSFISPKVDPDDIDVTYLLDGKVYDTLSATKQGKVKRLSARQGSVSALRHHKGLRVDCFTFVTRLVAMPWGSLDADEADYFSKRGLWDDWWQRERSGPKGSDPVEHDAVPRRGYLEVAL